MGKGREGPSTSGGECRRVGIGCHVSFAQLLSKKICSTGRHAPNQISMYEAIKYIHNIDNYRKQDLLHNIRA